MATAVRFKYRAFLSYSHRDGPQGEWLHKALERHTIDKDLVGRETPVGPVPTTLRPIFRDRDDFSAGHSLTDQTLAALEASQFLIVMCSPSAVNSRYVDEEIRLFKAMGRSDRVIPVIVAGEPNDPDRECFPQALRFKVDSDGAVSNKREEPIAADARPHADGREVAKQKVVAALLGLSFDEVIRRAKRFRRQRLRKWIGAALVLCLILAGLVGWAENNQRDAEDQRRESEQNFETAKATADGVVFELAQGLQDVEGMRLETVRHILSRGEDALSKLSQVASGPNHVHELRRTQAAIFGKFSDTYSKLGDLERAIEYGQKSVHIMREESGALPTEANLRHNLSVALSSLGYVFRARGDVSGALTAYREELAIAHELVAADGANINWRMDVTAALEGIGRVLMIQGDFNGALEAFREGLNILRGIVGNEAAANTETETALSGSLVLIGNVLMAQRHVDGALMAYRESLGIARKVSSKDPSNTARRAIAEFW